jgi:hypothetical protein
MFGSLATNQRMLQQSIPSNMNSKDNNGSILSKNTEHKTGLAFI